MNGLPCMRMDLLSKKIVFIDIDGTLTTPDGRVPSSAKQAIRTARQNGHLMYLCTGRSKPEIIFSILEIGFDGEAFTMYRTTVAQFGPESGEIAVKGVDKYKAVKYVLNVLQIPREQSMAYGDGNNDIKMFEAVHYGVAMENATDDLKKVAREITTKAEDDGIMHSFKRHHLL